MRRALASALAFLAAATTAARGDESSELKAAIAWATPVMGEECDFASLENMEDLGGSHVFDISYRYRGQGQDEPNQVFPLIQLYCSSGAYNVSFIFLTKTSEEGQYKLLSFASPKLDFDYKDENFTQLKSPPRVAGYVASTELVNADYDPKTMTIHSNAKWRGLGDAWSSGEWRFDEGQFVLARYDVDPIYELNKPDAVDNDPDADIHYLVYPDMAH